MNNSIIQNIPERIAAALLQSGIAYRIHAHADQPILIHHAADFALALGVDPACILKTVFLREQAKNGRFALACCSSTQKLDLKAAAKALEYGRLEFAPETELARELGYPRHGVSPLGAPAHLPVLLDTMVLKCPNVLVGAGIAGVEIALSSEDLVAVTRAMITPLTRGE